MATPAELRIEAVLQRYLMREFTFLAPRTRGDGPHVERELADVLIWLTGTLIIVQSKMPDERAHETRTPDRRRRWYRKAARDAHRQIRRTWTYVVNKQVVELDNGVLRRRDLDAKKVERIVGLAVVGDESTAEHEGVVLRAGGRDIPCLTLTLTQFADFVRAYDTIGDLVDAVAYGAEVVTAVSRRGILPTAVGCLAATASRFIDPHRFDDAVACAVDVKQSTFIWDEFTKPGGGIDQVRRARLPAYVLDELFINFHTTQAGAADVAEWVGPTLAAQGAERWPEALEYMASLRRSDRVPFGEFIEATMREARERGAAVYRHMRLGDKCLVFLASRESPAKQMESIGMLSYAVLAALGVPHVLGISCQPGNFHAGHIHFVQVAGEAGEVPPSLAPLVERVRKLGLIQINLDPAELRGAGREI